MCSSCQGNFIALWHPQNIVNSSLGHYFYPFLPPRCVAPRPTACFPLHLQVSKRWHFLRDVVTAHRSCAGERETCPPDTQGDHVSRGCECTAEAGNRGLWVCHQFCHFSIDFLFIVKGGFCISLGEPLPSDPFVSSLDLSPSPPLSPPSTTPFLPLLFSPLPPPFLLSFPFSSNC